MRCTSGSRASEAAGPESTERPTCSTVAWSAGVNCSLSSNNVLNPATPYGDCSLIRMANLQANLLQVSQPKQLRECFAMLTERSARILNVGDYGIKVGNPADIVVIDSTSPERAVAEIRHPVAVFKRGRRTVTWHPAELGLGRVRQ